MKVVAPVEIRIPADHPVFAGHFPARPIVPGAMLLDRVAAAAAAVVRCTVTGVAAAKFLQPVGPGEPLQVNFDLDAGDRLRFEVRGATAVVAKGTLWIVAATPPGGA